MIIGFCGYAKAGKDTACTMLGLKRMAFADQLKKDLRMFCIQHYNIDPLEATPEEKEIIRPLLVAHGAAMRKVSPNYWVDLLLPENFEPKEDVGITDVRYFNEAKRICDLGGIVFHILNNRVMACNDEEQNSILEIMARRNSLRHIYVYNDMSLEKFRRNLQEEYEYARASLAT